MHVVGWVVGAARATERVTPHYITFRRKRNELDHVFRLSTNTISERPQGRPASLPTQPHKESSRVSRIGVTPTCAVLPMRSTPATTVLRDMSEQLKQRQRQRRPFPHPALSQGMQRPVCRRSIGLAMKGGAPLDPRELGCRSREGARVLMPRARCSSSIRRTVAFRSSG